MKKTLIVVLIGGVVLVAIFALNQYFVLKKAHSTFENYYAFRGCIKLLEKKTDYGICKIGSGKTIKIVRYNNKWYLDGDLPWACIGTMCFGI